MSSDLPLRPAARIRSSSAGAAMARERSWAMSAISALASLRLTVALFAMGIFIILVGTLAQTEKDMWQVIGDYFHTALAWIEFRVFLPRSFFPNAADIPPQYGFWFPGGRLIGVTMAVNLAAAHLVRFKVQAKGAMLWFGWMVMGLGGLVTWFVVDSGHNPEGLQGVPAITWDTLWMVFKLGLAASAVGCAAYLVLKNPGSAARRTLWACGAALLGGIAVWLLLAGDAAMPNPSSLRILWQLMLASFAALTVLAGSVIVFRKRSGIVVLHAGVALIMMSEFMVSQYAVEGRMRIREGETMNYTRDIRVVELALINRTSPEADEVVVVPRDLLTPGAKISDAKLPVDLVVHEFYKNAELEELAAGQAPVADQGIGKRFRIKPVRAASGADAGGAVDLAAAYVEFFEKGTSHSLGKFLLAQQLSIQDISEKLNVAGTTYDVALRFKRNYKDYRILLKDFRKDDYLGTSTPRNYSSEVRLVDDTRQADFEKKIWMNNPLRYAGETFYQSGFNLDPDGVEATDLQVVTNTGWMMPYVGCMYVVIGMLVHFGQTLSRFVRRQFESVGGDKRVSRRRLGLVGWSTVAVIVLVCGGYILSQSRPVPLLKAGMKLHEFATLPIIHQGRVKPVDTLARITLRAISDRETFRDNEDRKQPAIRWFLDVIAGTKEAADHRVFRIDHPDLLGMLGLPRRAGLRYSINEIRDKLEVVEEQARKARDLEPQQRSDVQRRLLELEKRLRAFMLVQQAFRPLPFPALPTEEEFQKDPQAAAAAIEKIKQLMPMVPQEDQMLTQMEAPLAVPVGKNEAWLPYATAWNRGFLKSVVMDEPPPRATALWSSLLASYATGNTATFNANLQEYKDYLAQETPAELVGSKAEFEYRFNAFSPFFQAWIVYLMAFVFVTLSWLLAGTSAGRVTNTTALGLICLALAVHTYAIVARIHISGRPPVTNLYSSAVFIGWAAVAFGIAIEGVFGLSIGNLLSSISGAAALLIAFLLASGGEDTFTVLQAVLDTQFWLATHVVCVTLGYSATFVAGILGIIYIGYRAASFFSTGGGETGNVRRDLTRMTYGTLCFALFFSFLGTVLGGLWADDSWGRFWGWDPKENGALIIVLWNALVLHARWGGMVRERGLAVLAVIGNITTSWSWFGVNELGIGLHSYGFTEGVLLALLAFVGSQLLVVTLGLALPAVGESARGDKTAVQLPTAGGSS